MKTTGRKSMRRLLCMFTSVMCLTMMDTVAFAAENDCLDELNAGAAVYLEGVMDEVADADTADVSNSDNGIAQEEEAQEASDEPDGQMSNLVMANVEDSVNVRAEANEDAEVVGKMFKNCGGEILEQSNGWTKLKSGNLEGWAKDEYLLFGEEALELSKTAGSLQATVLADALRVRKEASQEAGVYGNIKQGEEIEVVEKGDEWITVRYDDDTVGYVAAEFVTVEYKVPTGKTKKEIDDEERAKQLAKLSENRGAVPTSVSDIQLLAALIQCEAGSQPYEGQLAVGAVVMNRVRSGGYPNTILEVITAPGQFPPATNGKVAAVLAKGPKASCLQAAQEAVNGATTVGGATHFNRAGSHAGIVIGGHVFW